MSYKSWGLYPKVKAQSISFNNILELKDKLQSAQDYIPFGNGRSYGDSALNDTVIPMRKLKTIFEFDKVSGVIDLESGVLLSEVLDHVVPQGWFLKITPGTKLITVGGAIASDIHGKNHHIDGCFSNSVIEFELLKPNGELVICSECTNSELFRYTCGGQGLTGIILRVKLQLKKIGSSRIKQTTIKTSSLKETFEVFSAIKNEPYSVAWIDCLATGNQLGRSHVMYGDFLSCGDLEIRSGFKFNIPFFFPSFILNQWSVKAFNWLFYNKQLIKKKELIVDFNSFFYPLDSINNWNRIYGRDGFLQYQFILPLKVSYEGVSQILEIISKSGNGSFLAVLKLYGKQNQNMLSFPMEGYSLALDLKLTKSVFELLDRLDEIVANYGGRIYLSKDARLSKRIFDRTYKGAEAFRRYRSMNRLQKLHSYQSRRLGL
jgi:decaprenylphospho-beta-D-ribofuranose 2-oxidase